MDILWLYMPVLMIALLEFSRVSPKTCAAPVTWQRGLFGPIFYHDPVNRNDVRDIELRLQRDIAESELRLHDEMRRGRYALMLWQTTLALVLAVLIACGFGWMGF